MNTLTSLWQSFRILGFLLIFGFLLSPHTGWPSSERELTLEQMVGLADEIVMGRVMSNVSRWEGKKIVTVTTIRVEEAISGRPGLQIEIAQLGGTAVHPKLGVPITMTVSEQVAFRQDEQVLLFLKEERPGKRLLVGGHQGKFVVREDPQTQKKDLPVGPKRLKVFREDERTTIAPEPITLDEMRERIRAHMDHLGKKK